MATASTRLKAEIVVSKNERPDLLGLQVVGVVIARAQYIGPQHDAPFDLVAESTGTSSPVHRLQTGRLWRAEAVSHAVVRARLELASAVAMR